MGALSFLEPHVKERTTSSNFSQANESKETAESLLESIVRPIEVIVILCSRSLIIYLNMYKLMLNIFYFLFSLILIVFFLSICYCCNVSDSTKARGRGGKSV